MENLTGPDPSSTALQERNTKEVTQLPTEEF